MTEPIPRNFFLASRDTPILPGDEIWQRPLPTSRASFEGVQTIPSEDAVTCGEYLSAVGSFLEKDNYTTVMKALARATGAVVTRDKVRNILIFLVKHGEFYHPVRVVVETDADDYALVVNGAVSAAGRAHIKEEFKLLAGLYDLFDEPVIPRVFRLEEVPAGQGKTIPMFCGEWFEGFREFHQAARFPEDRSRLIVWGQDQATCFLTREQAADVYRQAARILTTAYNFYTFEHITAWHHAAGDFIVKPVEPSGIDLRLITIRKYAPMIDNSDPEPADQLEGLLLFLINLTVRNRLDRLDGTGALAWADDFALEATLVGFFEGLAVLTARLDLPDNFPEAFKNYVQAHPPEALQALFSAVAARIPAASSEHDFVAARLEAHTGLFSALMASR